jgi:hypothetical protein
MAHIETDPELEPDDDPDLTVPEFGGPESETTILNDILVDDGDGDEANEMDVVVGVFDIPLIWAVPVSSSPSIIWIQ